jgi:hypothetical protein
VTACFCFSCGRSSSDLVGAVEVTVFDLRRIEIERREGVRESVGCDMRPKLKWRWSTEVGSTGGMWVRRWKTRRPRYDPHLVGILYEQHTPSDNASLRSFKHDHPV